jgi:hypothetical protein
MEIVIAIVVIIICVAALAMSPMTRRVGDAVDSTRPEVDRQFRKPPNKGGLL